eukprot:Tbor_TRINITY_DN6225_c7_g3::TRINITY_DN6225_c7_g3_i3::g.1958::m.1958
MQLIKDRQISRKFVLAASHWTFGSLVQSKDNSRFCSGNPVWLTDAAGYNSGMLWAPRGCAYTYCLNYTTGYAKSVVSQIIRDVIGTKATVFGKNLGIHHMIG